jgi:biopolymer transport protein ExbD
MAFGEFDASPASAPMKDINVTPLVDVMLVLLVIFIITAPLLTGSLNLELPSAAAPAAPRKGVPVDVALDSQSVLTVDGQVLDLKQLAAALSLRAADGAATEVQLRIDKSVPYGRVAEVMAEIQKSELQSLSLAVQTPAPKIGASPPPLRP